MQFWVASYVCLYVYMIVGAFGFCASPCATYTGRSLIGEFGAGNTYYAYPDALNGTGAIVLELTGEGGNINRTTIVLLGDNEGDNLGHAVAVGDSSDGEIILVTAPKAANSTGAVYSIDNILRTNALDSLGLLLHDDLIDLLRHFLGDQLDANADNVYVMNISDSTQFVLSGEAEGDEFGYAIATEENSYDVQDGRMSLSQNWLSYCNYFIAAPGASNSDNQTQAGKVYILDGASLLSNYTPPLDLLAEGESSGDRCGSALDAEMQISNNESLRSLAIGCPTADAMGKESAGAAHFFSIYRNTTYLNSSQTYEYINEIEQIINKLLLSTDGPSSGLVGGGSTGTSVFVPGSGGYTSYMYSRGENPGDNFGSSVSVEASVGNSTDTINLLAGSPHADVNGFNDSGSVYLHQFNMEEGFLGSNNTASTNYTMRLDGPSQGGLFGSAVDIVGGIVAGAFSCPGEELTADCPTGLLIAVGEPGGGNGTVHVLNLRLRSNSQMFIYDAGSPPTEVEIQSTVSQTRSAQTVNVNVENSECSNSSACILGYHHHIHADANGQGLGDSVSFSANRSAEGYPVSLFLGSNSMTLTSFSIGGDDDESGPLSVFDTFAIPDFDPAATRTNMPDGQDWQQNAFRLEGSSFSIGGDDDESGPLSSFYTFAIPDSDPTAMPTNVPDGQDFFDNRGHLAAIIIVIVVGFLLVVGGGLALVYATGLFASAPQASKAEYDGVASSAIEGSVNA